jgi:hypothetical protein
MTASSPAFDEFSIEQLLAAIETKKKSRLGELRAKQIELTKMLRRIDDELAVVTTGARPRRRGRPPKNLSIPPIVSIPSIPTVSTPGPARRGRPPGRPARGPGEAPTMGTLVLEMLAAAGDAAISLTEMTGRLKDRTTSDKPGIIISQALIRLKKDALVESAGRGLYRATAAGRQRAARL